MLNGTVVLTFGQTLNSTLAAAHVPGTYVFSGNVSTPKGQVTIDGNTLLHATAANTPDVITEKFTPAAGGTTVTSTLDVTVNQANWQVTADSGSGTYSPTGYALDGTFGSMDTGTLVPFMSQGQNNTWIEASADANLPISYNVSNSLTPNLTAHGVTSIAEAGTFSVTPVVNSAALEPDGTPLRHDVNISYATNPTVTVVIAQAPVTVTATSAPMIYGGTASVDWTIGGLPTGNPDDVSVSGYDVTNLDGTTPTLSGSGNLKVGTYDITPILSNPNYVVTGSPSTLTVDKAQITATLNTDPTETFNNSTSENYSISLSPVEYQLTFNDGTDQATAQLNVTDTNGVYLATSGTLDVTSGPDIGDYTLIPGNGPTPWTISAPSGYFTVDNILYPTN